MCAWGSQPGFRALAVQPSLTDPLPSAECCVGLRQSPGDPLLAASRWCLVGGPRGVAPQARVPEQMGWLVACRLQTGPSSPEGALSPKQAGMCMGGRGDSESAMVGSWRGHDICLCREHERQVSISLTDLGWNPGPLDDTHGTW